jgi:hypothetical protein
MRNNSLTAALGLLAVFFPIAAQQHPAPPPAHPAPLHQRSTAAAAAPARPTDAQIEAAIRVKLAKSKKIGPEKFRFKVQGGVATIEGNTDVVQHKGAATRMAKTAGAIAVNNHIQISDAAKQRAAANLENGRRRAQIKREEPRSATVAPRGAAPAVVRKSITPTVQNR